MDRSPAEMNQSILLKKGDVLVVGTSKKGTYTYLSIGGLLQASKAFGSYSTYLPASFGGLEGRTLKKGDMLSSRGTEAYTKRTIPEWSVAKFSDQPVIRILKDPEWETLSDAKALEKQSFEVHASSNRMGIRLTNPPLKHEGREIASCPVIPGTIQLPGSGEPIVLMNDCQTTGGYPRIGKVIAADMDRLAQLRAGHCLTFRLVDREEARNQQRFREQTLKWIMG